MWHVRTCSSITPASEEGGRGQQGRQVGKTASRPCGPTLPRWGRRVGCTARWVVQGVAGHCLGYVLHNACTCCTVLAPYSVTPQCPGQLLFIIHHCTGQPSRAPLWAASIEAQVGWRATAMTKTRRGRQERDARYCGVAGTVCTVVPSLPQPRMCLSVSLSAHSCHSAVAAVYSTRRAGLLAYERGKPAQYITRTHAHNQRPPTRSYLRL